MKILFDPQIFQIGYSGMRRYYSVLYTGLLDAGIDIVYPQKSPFSSEPIEQTYLDKTLPKKVKRVVNKITFFTTKERYYKALSKLEYDLVYITSPSFETGFLNHIQGKPFVMTVHDTMQTARGLHALVDQPRDTMALGYLAHYAKKVATVSEYTKSDLCNKYLVDPSKVKRVYLADFLGSATEKMDDLPEHFVLNVGNRNGRKNFYEWIKSVSPYLRNKPDLYVIVTNALTTFEMKFYEKLGVSKNIISKEDVSDAQLATLYHKALCLVYPSLYEGFGLPVLEAMSRNCPVITSNCTSIPEVGGSAALYIDPMDSENMLETFVRFMESSNLRNELSKKGFEQSKKFSKEKFISGMIDLFEEAIKKS